MFRLIWGRREEASGMLTSCPPLPCQDGPGSNISMDRLSSIVNMFCLSWNHIATTTGSTQRWPMVGFKLALQEQFQFQSCLESRLQTSHLKERSTTCEMAHWKTGGQ
eukprot:4758336-Amphidinium_carterae.1